MVGRSTYAMSLCYKEIVRPVSGVAPAAAAASISHLLFSASGTNPEALHGMKEYVSFWN